MDEEKEAARNAHEAELDVNRYGENERSNLRTLQQILEKQC